MYKSNDLRNSKILITGGSGFIGTTLTNALCRENDVTIIDRNKNTTEVHSKFSKPISVFHGDITDIDFLTKVFTEKQYDYIFHLCGVSSVTQSLDNPLINHKINVESTINILELIREYQINLTRFVFLSSATVYDGKSPHPKNEENSMIRPMSPYAIDKYASESFILSYFRLYGVPASVIRLFNVYGPNRYSHVDNSGVLKSLITAYKHQINGKDLCFEMYGDGEQTRDFIFLEDVINALIFVASSNYANGEIFNVGTGTATSIIGLIDILNDYFKITLDVEYKPTVFEGAQYSVASIDKLKKIGFHPEYDLLSGLKLYIDFIFNNSRV